MLEIARLTIDTNKVGAHIAPEGGFATSFGIYLPNITYAKGYQVIVRIIHEKDQFKLGIPAKKFLLTFDPNDPLGLWHATINISDYKDDTSTFGNYGTYLYHYALLKHSPQPTARTKILSVYEPVRRQFFDNWQAEMISDEITDPFAREIGHGKISAFTIRDPQQPVMPFQWTDEQFRVPALDDLMVYELQIEEFGPTFDDVTQCLDHLTSLGVNALELMPINCEPEVFDWGSGTSHFFALSHHLGGNEGLKRLVNACHQNNIAVILDCVYQHVSVDFAYNKVYRDAGEAGPMGAFPSGTFGPETTFPGYPFTQEFFHKVNQYWLQEYHIDGFRYDDVRGRAYYDGPVGGGYAALVYKTYQDSLMHSRFKDTQGTSRIIQCAEVLSNPQAILAQTYSNATWQDALLNKVRDMATKQYVDQEFLNLLNPYAEGYPASRDFNGIQGPVAPFQYLNSHDHAHLLNSFGLISSAGGPDDLKFGNRANAVRLQPYVIALLTCQGIPMLWQGEELAENYTLPEGGNARIFTPHPIHGEYFYDQYGQGLVRLYRIVGRLRQQIPALRSRELVPIQPVPFPNTMVCAYERKTPMGAKGEQQVAIVVLNFSGDDENISLPFSKAGTYREMINNDVRAIPWDLTIHNDGETQQITVPSNYGCIFVKQ